MKGLPELERLGAGLAVVGLGNPTFAKGFRESTRYVGPLFVDGEGRRVPGRGAPAAAPVEPPEPAMLPDALRAKKEGFAQGKAQGDPWQLGAPWSSPRATRRCSGATPMRRRRHRGAARAASEPHEPDGSEVLAALREGVA